MSLFDKFHSFLFHSMVTEKLSAEDTGRIIKSHSLKHAVGKLMDEERQSKFVTNAAMVADHPFSIISEESDMNGASSSFYEYGFGKEIKYHEHVSRFPSLRQELVHNDVFQISEQTWDDVLAVALKYARSQYVQLNYRARQNEPKYGVVEGEVIVIEVIVSIMIYCNFDELQAAFSRSFRKQQIGDTEDDIIQQICNNYYWLGRYVICVFE